MYLHAVGRRFTQMNAYFLVMNSKRCNIIIILIKTQGCHYDFKLMGVSKLDFRQRIKEVYVGSSFGFIFLLHCFL